jgi:hypothetical protein
MLEKKRDGVCLNHTSPLTYDKLSKSSQQLSGSKKMEVLWLDKNQRGVKASNVYSDGEDEDEYGKEMLEKDDDYVDVAEGGSFLDIDPGNGKVFSGEYYDCGEPDDDDEEEEGTVTSDLDEEDNLTKEENKIAPQKTPAKRSKSIL